ncbi:MAG: 1-hydroxycarotenoid 3,4-desaturase CrtD [Pseudomonadota bacterium]
MRRLGPNDKIAVIGAGIGGLSAALLLASAGRDVVLIEAADGPGGKLRTVPSAAGPVDAGPTVLTLLPVFEALFEAAGEDLHDHLSVRREPLLARHWWPDNSTLDLHADGEASAAAVRAFAGPKAEGEFRAFHRDAARLFRAFEAPVMQAARPDLAGILMACLRNPRIIPSLAPPRTLWAALAQRFTDKRLAQLFARYATYVGGSPFDSPALLSLIWSAEAAGVWTIEGGMAKLAHAIEHLLRRRGIEIRYSTPVSTIQRKADRFDIHCADGTHHDAAQVVFNGDPAALTGGLLGPNLCAAVRPAGVTPRSLSAYVWAFAAKPEGRDLAHHNVFFNTDYRTEFDAIDAGRVPDDAALYVCAQDRGAGPMVHGLERFEIILNGAPTHGGQSPDPQEFETCLTRTFETLSRRGLSFDPVPGRAGLTTPRDFSERFPGSAGSLYGLSPHGTMASFNRPVVRSRIPGLYLAGGGVHPGAGLPMAATSGRLAAEAILKDLASTSRSRRMAMRGGTSTDYLKTAPAVSRSSPS